MPPKIDEEHEGPTRTSGAAQTTATITVTTTDPRHEYATTGAGETDQPVDQAGKQLTEGESDDERGKAYVAPYENKASFPFEIGEIVWIVKPGYRVPLGEFRISKAHSDDLFELVSCTTNTTYAELVEGKYLRRDV